MAVRSSAVTIYSTYLLLDLPTTPDLKFYKPITQYCTRCDGVRVAQLVEALRYKPDDRGFNSDGVTGIFH
jgi:hypothetical protein